MARKKQKAAHHGGPRRSTPRPAAGPDFDLSVGRIRRVLEARAPWTLELGDSMEVLKAIPDGRVDALVTDPPAGIEFMGQDWDSYLTQPHDPKFNVTTTPGGRQKVRHGTSGGYHKPSARSNFIAAMLRVFTEAFRVLKPGTHGLVWALPRTSHWTATALEDAGFEVRDVVTHHFGNGFPKSLDVGKAIDARLGTTAAREVARAGVGSGIVPDGPVYAEGLNTGFALRELTAAASAEAKAHEGEGTALKPGTEHWILIRKPLEGTVAGNVLRHGTGGLQIDACRIDGLKEVPASPARADHPIFGSLNKATGEESGFNPNVGRWPANVILTHSETCTDAKCTPGCPVATLDEQSGERDGAVSNGKKAGGGYGGGFGGQPQVAGYADTGGASRFFYVPKPSRAERDAGLEQLPLIRRTDGRKTEHQVPNLRTSAVANWHPTVKSIELMVYLCRLVTPPGGVVLDPFAGSGTTLIAATRQGFRAIGVEREKEYHALATARVTEDMPLFNRTAPAPATTATELPATPPLQNPQGELGVADGK